MSKKLSVVETDVEKLHQVSKEINLNDIGKVNAVESSLIRVYNKLHGCIQGIAAIQTGFAYRVMLLRYVKGKEPIIVYNPVVNFEFGSKESRERCQSELDVEYIVKRPILVKVTYYTKYKEKVTEWLTYKRARIFMHEYDHLNGILLQDKGVAVG